MVSNWLGLVGPARTGMLAVALFGVATLDGCNSLSAASESAISLPTSGDGSVGNFTDDGGLAMGTSCHPGNVETFVAGAYVPAIGAGQGACAAADGGDPIRVYYDACFGPNGSSAACAAFGQVSPAYAACASCIVTAATAQAYGPLVLAAGFSQPNVAGCIELKDPSDIACAQAQQALFDCELAACSANCQASRGLYNTCAHQADEAGCQAYYAAAKCLETEVADGGPESACVASNFQAFYQAVVPLFCGQASADAASVQDAIGQAESADGSSDARASGDAEAGQSSEDATSDGEPDVRSDGSVDASPIGDGASSQDASPTSLADGI